MVRTKKGARKSTIDLPESFLTARQTATSSPHAPASSHSSHGDAPFLVAPAQRQRPSTQAHPSPSLIPGTSSQAPPALRRSSSPVPEPTPSLRPTRFVLAPLLTLAQPYYPTLMNQFYASAQCTDYTSIQATVLGIPIMLNRSMICDILRIPNQGTCLLHPQTIPQEPFTSRDQIAQVYGAYAQRHTSHYNVSNLSSRILITELLIAEILNPRLTRSSLATATDILICYHLMRQVPLNLGSVIITQMIDCALRQKNGLFMVHS